MIRAATANDARQICEIYNHFVRETVVTFEEAPVAETEMAKRITDTLAHLPWLIWEEAGTVAGYAYARPWRPRAAYRHSVESSIYLAPRATGRGIGPQLYRALIQELRDGGLHCVIGGAALPNPASVSLHEKLGFTKVAEFKQVGYKFGRWIDVAYWELIL